MAIKNWFNYGRGLKTSPGVQNRSFKGDGAANPVWSLLGHGIMNKRQITTQGAFAVMPYQLPQVVSPQANYSGITQGTIQNPMRNKGIAGNGGNES